MKIAVDARTMGSSPSGIGMYTYNFLCEFAKDSETELILISDVDISEQMQEMKKLGIPVWETSIPKCGSISLFCVCETNAKGDTTGYILGAQQSFTKKNDRIPGKNRFDRT